MVRVLGFYVSSRSDVVNYRFVIFLSLFLMVRLLGCSFFFQAEDGIRDLVRSRGLGDVYKRQRWENLLKGKRLTKFQNCVCLIRRAVREVF